MSSSIFRRASSGFRANSFSIWSDGGVEVFSKSLDGDDDDEALKWAAIERLPTFDRLRKGLLKMTPGEANEVDVQDLGSQERKILIDCLVKDLDKDHEKFLLKLKNRIDRVGIEIPSIEVRFEHLIVEAEVLGVVKLHKRSLDSSSA